MKLKNPFKKINPAKELGKVGGQIIGNVVSGAVGGLVEGVFGEDTPERKAARAAARELEAEQRRIEAVKSNRQSWLFRFFITIECIIIFQFIMHSGIDNASFELLFEKRSILLALPFLGWIVGALFINKTKI